MRIAIVVAAALLSWGWFQDDDLHRVVAALRRGDAAAPWAELRAGPDNTRRTAMIAALSATPAAAGTLVGRLRNEPDASVRHALLVALGGQAPPLAEAALTEAARLYATDSDAGVHGAAAWLLRRHGALAAQPALPIGEDGDRARGWYMTRTGHTLSIAAPTSVLMGSPDDETGRQAAPDSPPEPQRRVVVPRAVAIGATEVTVAQFRRFLDARPDVRERHRYPESATRMAEVLARFSPDDAGPMIAVTWYEAAMYCNWLSAEEGLPPSERVYPDGILGDGTTLPRGYLSRTGYRLPTEAEWEMAVRAGTATARFFGRDDTRLADYAWFSRRPPQRRGDPIDPADPRRTSRVGLLRPNDLGLFDVYGNVWEWTQDRVERGAEGATAADVEDAQLVVRDTDARTRRGGAFPYGLEAARSAGRGTLGSLPTNRRDNVGFRIARTMPVAGTR